MSYITARSSVAPMPIVRAVPSSSAGARSSRRRPWEGPAAGEDTADESVVDAELAVLAVRPLLGGAGVAVHVGGVAGIGVDEDELADVVKQRREHEPVAVLVAELGGETLCGALGGAGMEAEAFGGCVPQAVAPEEVEGARAGDDGLDGLGREHLDRLADAVDVAACLAVDAVGQAHDRD